MKRKKYILLAVMAGVFASVGVAQEMAKLMASDRQAEDLFGLAVAISGDHAAVGAPGEDTWGHDAGAVYVFRRYGTEWVEQDKLSPSDGGTGYTFGSAVAMSGDYLMVGADGAWTGNTRNTGAVYVFHYSGGHWVEQAKLTAADAEHSQHFGHAIAMRSNLAVIGAWGDDTRGLEAGAAYVFSRSGAAWTQRQKLIAADGEGDDSFGIAVALDGNFLVVGASGDNDLGVDSGSAYVYYYNGSSWNLQQKLTTSDGITHHYFGESVAISGNHVVIGAPGDADAGSWAGAAYGFARYGATWTATTKLTPADAGPADAFGHAVAFTDTSVLVAARGEHAVYAFTWDGTDWLERTKMWDPDGGGNDVFAYALAAGADRAIVGAFGDDNEAGSAYIYDGMALQTAPVYRFWSPGFANHFYTISKAEKDYVIATWSRTWMYEGVSYYAFPANTAAGLSPVYRFWSSKFSSHFYTTSVQERDHVIATFPGTWTYEGVVFYAFAVGNQPADAVPVYRFWSPTHSAHFYTASESEKNSLINNPEWGWQFECIAWYGYSR